MKPRTMGRKNALVTGELNKVKNPDMLLCDEHTFVYVTHNTQPSFNSSKFEQQVFVVIEV